MAAHVIVVDDKSDLEWAGSAGIALTARDFVTNPERLQGKKLRVVNLSGEYFYLDFGYYTSLLAEARGYKVVPNVAVMTLLARKRSMRRSGAQRDPARDIEKMADKPVRRSRDARFGKLTDPLHLLRARGVRSLRCPLLRAEIERDDAERHALELAAPRTQPREFDRSCMRSRRRADWQTPKRRHRHATRSASYNPGEHRSDAEP